MPSKLTVEFEFEIGELVFFKAAQHTANHRPKQFTIVERFAQQCHGGVQRLYKLDDSDKLIPEIALTGEEPPFRPLSKSQIQAENELQELRDSYWTERLESRRKRKEACSPDQDANESAGANEAAQEA